MIYQQTCYQTLCFYNQTPCKSLTNGNEIFFFKIFDKATCIKWKSHLFPGAGLFSKVLILLFSTETSFVEEIDAWCFSDSLPFCFLKYFDWVGIFSLSFSKTSSSVVVPLHKIRKHFLFKHIPKTLKYKECNYVQADSSSETLSKDWPDKSCITFWGFE